MFALGIRYLNGWSMAAADGPQKKQPEWPPHPDRIFSALAAAWFETGEDSEEGETLRWLESLPAPSLACTDATKRKSVFSYVPVNDTARTRNSSTSGNLKKMQKTGFVKIQEAGLALLPEFRARQPRGFPVVVPYDPNVYLLWPDADMEGHREGLNRLVAKVTHIGHSASFVQVWVEEKSAISPALVPDDAGNISLRVPTKGRLEYLKRSCNRDQILEYADLKERERGSQGKEKERIKKLISSRFGSSKPTSQRPRPGSWKRYSVDQNVEIHDEQGTVFDPRLMVFTVNGKRVSSRATLKMTQALRNALMSSCPVQPPPEWLSGHRPDGTRSTKPHLAFLSLPFVGGQHSDGRIMGLALAFPRNLEDREITRCLENFLYDPGTRLPLERRLFGKDFPECLIEIETRVSPPINLVSNTWVRKSCIWASVTPVVLNRHYNGKDRWERAAENVKDACSHIGLPRPQEVILHPVSWVRGVPHSREFPLLERKDGNGKRNHSHAVIIFDTQVQGPVVVGAGRFRGYGLFRPMDRGTNAGE